MGSTPAGDIPDDLCCTRWGDIRLSSWHQNHVHFLFALCPYGGIYSTLLPSSKRGSEQGRLYLQAEPDGTTVYIGNICAEVTDVEIRQLVSHYGEVIDMSFHRKGNYAFVQVIVRRGRAFYMLNFHALLPEA